MSTQSPPLPELEVQLIARRSERRQAAIRLLKDDPDGPRWAWALGSAACVAIPFAASRFGEGLATLLGLTKDGIGWVCIPLVSVIFLAVQVFVLERKVKALTHLMLSEPNVPPTEVLRATASGGG